MPMAMGKEIAQSWFFASSSGNGVYETLVYVGKGGTSCSCPGWTRRVDAHGNRSCKHTRMVEQGVADQYAESTKTYTVSTSKPNATSTTVARRAVQPPPEVSSSSRFGSKPKEPPKEPPTRSRFKVEVPVDDSPVDAERFKRI